MLFELKNIIWSLVYSCIGQDQEKFQESQGKSIYCISGLITVN